MRRLTEDQYKNIVRDTFGPEIIFGGRMDPDLPLDGLVAIGTTESTVTAVGFEQYDGLARSIAAQVMEPRRRQVLLPCDPQQNNALDKACTTTIVTTLGQALFRRPLTDEQRDRYVRISTEAAEKLADPYKGMQFGLGMMLTSPSFIFQKERVEVVKDAPKGADPTRLDPYSKASRLSFFLWDSAPDQKLLAAAASGEIETPAGLQKQVDRMLASPRIEGGTRAFFKDFFQYSLFSSLAKDSVIYPKFSQQVGLDAQEQALRTITDHLIEKDRDYRDLFTTRDTFMSRALGVVYQVPVEAGEAWVPYTFDKEDPRAGLLSELSFTALYAHPGRSSPTLRGKAIREVFLCQTVPVPPNNVDFTQFEKASAEKLKTARDRLQLHATDPVCAGCHKIIDPLGLGLENFDGLGAYRDVEGDTKIDTTGALDGVAFTDAAGLGKALHDNKNTSACVVKQLYAYGTGRKIGKTETAWIDFLQQSFASDGYKFKTLLRRIALSDNFYRVVTSTDGTRQAAVSPLQSGSKSGG